MSTASNKGGSSRFPSPVYGDRLERAAAIAGKAGLDGLLITPGPDLQYMLGTRAQSYERLTCLVVPSNGGKPTIVVPKLELAGIGDSATADLGLDIRDWVDGQDVYGIVKDLLGGTRAAVAEAMPALHLVPLADKLGALPILATGVLRDLRMVKDASEIDALRRAGQAIDRVHARMGEWLRAGRTEAEVAADINRAIVEEGHTHAEFIIVGSGPNGANPHHEVSDRMIEPGDIVVIDIGGPVEPGYNSDSTRTYAIGKPPSGKIADQYEALQRAQQAAVDAVRPGITAEAVDAAARDPLVGEGLGEYFVHRTGHGIGLSVHEEPYIVSGNDIVLAPGMAFSVEPGIYFRGDWGARIEDIVVVTEDGCEPMNTRPHDLVVLPG
ncbi:M24 family metallopeptidase [Aldersonia kunmingensis]|uniref:M24 family metallopeptidase n=1 Tax=Aldersonia kunmingensis TaxID=408066 RepID=UPI0008297E78|nr:Xaa-Pro peptidase family protein [Aldersonia kunmingensis]